MEQGSRGHAADGDNNDGMAGTEAPFVPGTVLSQVLTHVSLTTTPEEGLFLSPLYR